MLLLSVSKCLHTTGIGICSIFTVYQALFHYDDVDRVFGSFRPAGMVACQSSVGSAAAAAP